jgi:hypothetical protein
MITTINEFRKSLNENIDTTEIDQYFTTVATLVLKKFSPAEIKMAGLSVEGLIKELTSFVNPDTHEEELHYSSLTQGIDGYYEEGVAPEIAADQLFKEFQPLVDGQLGAM